MAKLNFVMQHQTQTNWCWAAVSTSVCGFYNASCAWSQCDLANKELGQTSCCSNGGSKNCNKPWYLEDGLQRVGHLRGTPDPNPEPFSTVENEINNRNVLGVRIGWNQGGGHFVVIAGCYTDAAGIEMLNVEDPQNGSWTIPYSQLVSSYQGSGAWTDSYFTT